MTEQAQGVNWSYMDGSLAPEGMTVPGSLLPLGKIGMKLIAYEWHGKKSGTSEVLGLKLDVEVVETPGHTGETASEDLFVGQTADPQRGEIEDLYAQDPETQKRRLKLLTAIARAVGVPVAGNSYGNILKDCLNRPFIGQTRARTTKDGTFVNLKTAYEFQPEHIAVDVAGLEQAKQAAPAGPGAPPPPPTRQAPPLGQRQAPPAAPPQAPQAPQAPPVQQAPPPQAPTAQAPPQAPLAAPPPPPPGAPAAPGPVAPPAGMPQPPTGSRIPPRA